MSTDEEQLPPPPPPPPPALAPVDRAERIGEMDVLRGIAVFGIFLVNMPLFNGVSGVFFNNPQTGWWPEWYNQAALSFIQIFAQAKFYTLFSFLFGLGFGVQMIRAEAKGSAGFAGTFRRRLAVLLAIGLVHFFLVWWGDVLHVYAILGFALLQFRKRSQKTLLLVAAALLLGPWLGGAGYFAFRAVVPEKKDPAKEAENKKKREENKQKAKTEREDEVKVLGSGSYFDIVKYRAPRNLKHMMAEIFWSIELFCSFLLGLALAKSGMLDRPSDHLAFFRRVMWGSLAVGIIGTAGLLYLRTKNGPDAPNYIGFLESMSQELFARPGVAFFYASGVVLLLQGAFWRRALSPLSAVGRMALSNYLFDSLLCTTIFYGYGFGYFGKIGFAAALALTAGIYICQIPASVWWLNRYRFGPVEWLWRSLTYGRRQPMRLW